MKQKKNNHELITLILTEDILRAKENILRHNWKNKIKQLIIKKANYYSKTFKDSYIKIMISEIIPGTETLCPNYVKKDIIGIQMDIGFGLRKNQMK